MRILTALISAAVAAQSADVPKGLTLHADFNGGTDAKVALGDKRIYFANSYKEQAAAAAGLGGADVELAADQGYKGGGALRFKKKNTKAVFYKAAGNVAFDPKNWTGSVLFRLSLDPETDLEPGFCDPIQVTDKAYNDSAIWVDFTKDEKPRHFRLGVFGALKAWNPTDIPPDKNPAFNNRLVVVKKTPFARGKWITVAITFSALGSGKGAATLYLDGKEQGPATQVGEAFEWDVSRGAVRLGVNYTGLMDDVMVFNRALSAAEVARLAR